VAHNTVESHRLYCTGKQTGASREGTAMNTPASSATVIATRLSLLAELDASAEVSFMNRSQLRLRVFGVVDRLDRGIITTTVAAELFERIESDVAALRAS
jgi:hypothetical protein